MSQAEILDYIKNADPAELADWWSFKQFSANYWRIPTKSKGLQPLRLNHAQRIVDAEFERQMKGRRFVRMNVLKCRQAGDTTYWVHRALKTVLHNDAHTALTIADKKETPAEWLARCQTNVDRTPECLRPAQDKRQAGYQIALKNGSRYYIGSAQGGFPGVGDTVHFLHLSELCWWDKPPISKDPDEVLGPLMPAVPSGSDVIGSVVARDSTGAMVGDWWNQRWIEGKDADCEYINVFLPWFLIETYRRDDLVSDVLDLTPDEREVVRIAKVYDIDLDKSQIAWRRQITKTDFHGDVDEAKAAYPSTEEEAFMAPGLTVYKPHHVVPARKTVREPIWRGDLLGDCSPSGAGFDQNASGDCLIWGWPDPRYHYVIGADCQWGKRKDADWDVCYVECLETGQVCAKIKGHYPLNYWGWQLAALGHKYNTCVIAPETNGQEAASAGSVIATLLGNVGDWSYPNVWIRSNDAKLKGFKPEDYGWWTTAPNKAQMIAFSQNGSENGSFDWCDKEAVTQMAFIIRHKDNSIGAPEGLHDDDWMARLITAYVSHRERQQGNLYVEPVIQPPVFNSMEDRLRFHLAGVINGEND